MSLTTRTAALAVAAVLTADGLLHVLWSTGSTWPAGDARALSYAVLGIDAPFTPPVVLPLAAALFGGAALVTARARLGRTHRLGRLLQAGTLAVACGTALRKRPWCRWACEGRAARCWPAWTHVSAGRGENPGRPRQ